MSEPEFLQKIKNNNLKVTHIIYGLQLIGLFTFIGFIFAIILNYIKLGDVRGTWLASHFRWQIRTFWFGILWCIVGGILAIFLIGYLILFINFIWMIYRIVKGWMNLIDQLSMYSYTYSV